ncbi:unnamed protein product [Pocillopora meandrina]|uniref:Uncharacterized protein n=1 Tax=Pocillopora meandrina TaxID=46732 RepID=A0AAU9WE07_9CNID|nr:unnamed protein product [Pocillopora meandrina]
MVLLSSSQIIKSEYWQVTLLYTSSSSVLVFCAPQKPHCIFANTEFCLWYGEDLRGFIENDKGGCRCVWCVGLISDLKNLELKNEYICSMLSVSFKSSAKDGISELMFYSYDLRRNLWKGEFSQNCVQMAHPRAGLMIHFFVRFKIRDDLLSHYLAKVNCLTSNTSIFKMKHSYSIGKTAHFRFFSRSDSVSTNYVYSCLFSFFFRSIQVTMLFKFALITMLATAFISEASANSCPRWVKLNKSPVCFGARDSQFGAFAYSQNIFVSSFMLVHRSGTVTCNKRHYSYWGCYPNHASINVVVTDHQNKLLAPAATNHGGWYNLSGYTSSSSALVFCAAKPHSIHANTQLRLWYGEDLRGYTENDNGGKTCADVYGLLV